MATVQESICKIEGLMRAIHSHPMCGNLFDKDGLYIVHYPLGDFPVDGLQCKQSIGKIAALEKLLARMEHDWIASIPTAA